MDRRLSGVGRVLIVGGYGNAGAKIARLMLEHSDHVVRVGGRDQSRASRLREVLVEMDPRLGDRVEWVRVDVRDPVSLSAALEGVDVCVNAAATAAQAEAVVQTVLSSRTHYLDIQVGRAKADRVLGLDPAARQAGITVVTDGGFHPGVPAAMVRYADQRLGGLERALVGSVIAIDWAALQPLAASTVGEMVEEFRDFPYEEFRDGRWRTAGRQPRFEFPAPFGVRKASAMGLAEMHQLTREMPGLAEAGFYVGGFNPVVDYAIVPLAIAGMRLAPGHLARPLGRLLHWGLVGFARPPYGTVLQLDGVVAGGPLRPLMRVGHADAYTVTAAPAVACALQLLDGSALRPGAHTQAMLVDPPRFFADMAQMGLTIDWLPDSAPAAPRVGVRGQVAGERSARCR